MVINPELLVFALSAFIAASVIFLLDRKIEKVIKASIYILTSYAIVVSVLVFGVFVAFEVIKTEFQWEGPKALAFLFAVYTTVAMGGFLLTWVYSLYRAFNESEIKWMLLSWIFPPLHYYYLWKSMALNEVSLLRERKT
jgi:predicted permease